MIAVIDIGSNTIRLSVYKRDSAGAVCQVSRVKRVVGLASYVARADGVLTQAGVDQTAAVLNEYRSMIDAMNIAQTHVFATSALRNITNTSGVLAAIKQKTNFDVDVISGVEEAMCGFDSVFANGGQDGLMIDIGGGSTEIVQRENGEMICVESIPIGSLNMYAKHVTKVLPTVAQERKIYNDAMSHLRKIKLSPISTIHGVGGVMRTLYRLNNVLFGADAGGNLSSATNLSDTANASSALSISSISNASSASDTSTVSDISTPSTISPNMTVAAKNVFAILKLLREDTRRVVNAILQITPERIHTLTPGLIILNAIIEKCNCATITASESGVREGYVIRKSLL